MEKKATKQDLIKTDIFFLHNWKYSGVQEEQYNLTHQHREGFMEEVVIFSAHYYVVSHLLASVYRIPYPNPV